MSNVKNVEALARLVGFCTGYGGTYKPGHLNLQVSSMQMLLDNARTVMAEANVAKTVFDNATNDRELAFLRVRKRCTSIISTLVACGTRPLTLEDARASVRKMWGMKAKSREPIPSENGEGVEKTRRARGLDYGTLAENFSKLVHTVSTVENYQANEPELSLEGLINTLAELRNLNYAVLQAQVQLSIARTNRDKLLYESASNVFGTAVGAKHYVKAVFGTDSDQYKEVVKLRFTKPTS